MNFENTRPLIIAIDGPSASGKGTVAKMLSEYFSIPHLNSGLIYRQLAFNSLKKNIDLENDIDGLLESANNINLGEFNENYLSNEKIGSAASIIANHHEIRYALLELQQNFIKNSVENFSGCVLDGRDMGTVIFPNASFKFFITACDEERARRRVAQEIEKSYDEILDDIVARDKRDKERKISPLTPAQDAQIIDNSNIDAKQTFQIILKNINECQN
jgi:cytidylate kinase